MRELEDRAKAQYIATMMAPLARKELSPEQIANSVVIIECFQASGSSRIFVGSRDGIVDQYCLQAGLAWFTAARREDAQSKIDDALPTDLPIWVIAHLPDGHLFSSLMVTRQGVDSPVSENW
jgi:hypothetical protein